MQARVLVAVSFGALVLAACATDSRVAATGEVDPSFYGRWRNVETKIYRADGTIAMQPDLQCVSEVSQSEAISECSFPSGGKSRVVSRFVSLTATGYELEITENDGAPHTVGSRSRVEYRIAGNRRFTTVYPQQIATSPVVKVEATYVRD